MATEVDILLVPKISDSTQLVGKSLTISDDTDGTPYRFSGDTINNAIQEIDDKVDRVDGYQLIATADVNRLADTSGENTGDQQASDFDIKDLTDSTDLRGTWSGKQDALGFTPENVANKSNDISSDANSTTKYPSVKAIKDYADGLVVGLLDDRGSFDASDNVWPSTGGSGVAGAIKKGDIWYISVEGTLGGVLAKVGYSIRALTDNPGQTASNWDILNVGLGYVPENVANKKTTITNSDVDYPTGKAVEDALALKVNTSDIANNLTTTEAGKVLDARQGKVLSDADALINTSINALKVADTKQQDSIQQIENTLNAININQEATATKEDCGTLALPKTAANGGMSVKLEGLTAENLVNGKNIAPAGSVTFATINGNKYYVSNQAALITGDGNNYTSTNSGSITINIIVINLTTTFGSGSEPLIAVAAKMFPTYFDGVKNFVAQGRLRSVGKNILNISPTNKKIYNGQDDGMTMQQRFAYYDIIIGGSRDGYINLNWVLNPDLSAVSIITKVGGYGIIYKFSATPGKVYSRTVNVVGGTDSTGIGFFDSQGNNLGHSVTSSLTAPANTSFGVICLTSDTFNQLISYQQIGVYESSIVPSYEPYTESALYLNSPALRSNGSVKDEIRKGANGYEHVKRISSVDGSVLATPIITPIAYGGLLNSNSNGTVYREKVIADAGVYSDKLSIQLTDYPISSFETIIKRSNGVETILNNATAVIAAGGLSFTHPDLQSGDLVLFTYYFANESTEGKTTLTYYDSRYVIADTANGKFYKTSIRSTNGVASIIVTEV